jgi:CYTH domain-containing protein/CHAD domain-containing protein
VARLVAPPSHIAELAPSALALSAAEGARIVTLHWLYELMAARIAWAESAGAGTTAFPNVIAAARTASDGDPAHDAAHDPARDTARSLHRARVALRRLRLTLREHRRLLRLKHGERYALALGCLQDASNALRDRDVRAVWLETNATHLSEDARADAVTWKQHGCAGQPSRERRQLARAFARHLDAHAFALARRLGEYHALHIVGEDHQSQRFAVRVADRLDAGRRRIDRAIARYGASGSEHQLHRLRMQFKRLRALLALHVGEHDALRRCYELLTHGQDTLGSMRDATLFAAEADRIHASALAHELRVAAAGHMARFAHTWQTPSEGHSATWEAASAALRAIEPHKTFAPHTPTFDAAAVALTHQLPLEIERKFLLHGLPPHAAVAPVLRIEQGWLPGTLLRERLRQTISLTGDVQRTRTIKLGQPGARIEVEEPVGAALFDALWPLTSDARIHKRRHLVVAGALTWEIDVFLDRDLVLAEVELHDTAQEVPIPAWLAPFIVKEVTDDPAYLNAVMAQRHVGAPEDARS